MRASRRRFDGSPPRTTFPWLFPPPSEGHYDSVPHRLLREQVEARVTARTIELFHKGDRVAVHVRSGAPQAQDLTAIRVAKAQFAVPSREALPTNIP